MSKRRKKIKPKSVIGFQIGLSFVALKYDYETIEDVKEQIEEYVDQIGGDFDILDINITALYEGDIKDDEPF